MMENPGFLCNKADPTKCEKFKSGRPVEPRNTQRTQRLKAEHRLEFVSAWLLKIAKSTVN